MASFSRLISFCSGLACGVSPAIAEDVLGPWREGVEVRAVDGAADRHSIHTYFNTCPESPDGQWILFFTSVSRDAHHGELRIRHRLTGEERVLARDLHVEDAHRAACQQWIRGGKSVVFHTERDGEWIIAAVDLDSGVERLLARDRLVCWGPPAGDVVPIYGKHWSPGPHRDLELLDVATGEIRRVLTADSVRAQYPQWFAKNFGDREVSLFFPELSPDGSRVFFKMAAAGENNPRTSGASERRGLFCYDLSARTFLIQRDQWGHPAWHPDSKRIVEVGWKLLDSTTGSTETLPGLPPMGSGHPSASPDGTLLVTDLTMDRLGGKASHWGIVVADARGGGHVLVHEFDHSGGALSWRRSHPHPVFNANGRRLYFNVGSGPWTRLHVAECLALPDPE